MNTIEHNKHIITHVTLSALVSLNDYIYTVCVCVCGWVFIKSGVCGCGVLSL